MDLKAALLQHLLVKGHFIGVFLSFFGDVFEPLFAVATGLLAFRVQIGILSPSWCHLFYFKFDNLKFKNIEI